MPPAGKILRAALLRALLTATALCNMAGDLQGAEPRADSWIMSRAPWLGEAALDVRAVTQAADSITIESGGLSLTGLGPLQAGTITQDGAPQRLRFTLKLHPRIDLAAQAPVALPGLWRNGIPVGRAAGAVSYRGQDFWHLDQIAAADDGRFTETGRPHPNPAPQSPFLAAVLTPAGRHSPLLGFAADGYPIYGPFGFDASGHVRAMRPGWHLRPQLDRAVLPDGTRLAADQAGPPVSTAFPAGSFVEDYAYQPGSGDLDRDNGRIAVTPEFPRGTYAYFLATGSTGRLAFPYVLTDHLHGMPAGDPPLAPPPVIGAIGGLIMRAAQAHPVAATPWRLELDSPFAALERLHEQPIHLLAIDAQLGIFQHLHPEMLAPGRYGVTLSLPHGGAWRLYAEYAPAGGAPVLARADVTALGAAGPPAPPPAPVLAACGPTVCGQLVANATAGAPASLRIALSDRASGTPVRDLQPYLAAWAHGVASSADGLDVAHGHAVSPAADSNPFTHSHAAAGPSPAVLEVTLSFTKPGPHALWLQLARNGVVETLAFRLPVRPGAQVALATAFHLCRDP